MSQGKRFSDEFLNAFVDDQLAAEEKSRAYVEINRDETLNREVCELRKMRDLVQLAYREPPAPPLRGAGGSRRERLRFGAAASVLLVLGALLGAQLAGLRTAQTPTAARVAANTPPALAHPAVAALHTRHTVPVARPAAPAVQPAPVASPQPQAETVTPATHDATPAMQAAAPAQAAAPTTPAAGAAVNKVLIHVTDNDSSRVAQALDDIEGLLKYYRDTHQRARVEIVLNGRGLDLVRTDTTAFAARIARLQKEFSSNLTFAACQNTIERIEQDQGTVVRLLPGVIVIDSGVAEIMRRQSQGWAYLQV